MWSLSRTRERPLRSSSTLLSKALVSTPIRLAMMKMPPRVTTSMSERKPQPCVAAHGAGVEGAHQTTPEDVDEVAVVGVSGNARNTHTRTLTTATSAMVARPSRPINAMVPRDIQLSNQ